MSHDTRPKPTLMTICDLCDQEITDHQKTDSGSLGREYGRPVTLPRTTYAWLIWPGADRRRRKRHEDLKADGELLDRQYDFHGECILAVVEAAIAERQGAQL